MLSEGERRFKIAGSCFGEIPARFEVCTPLGVLTLTQSAVAAAIYTSCGRIGPPTNPPTLIFLKRFSSFFPSCLAIPLAGFTNASARNQKMHKKKKPISSQSAVRAGFYLFISPFFFLSSSFSCCYFRRPGASTPSPWLASQVPRGSQSESPNQCISSNSHTLLILPLKFMLLFPAGGPPAGWGPRRPPYSRGHGDTRSAAPDAK